MSTGAPTPPALDRWPLLPVEATSPVQLGSSTNPFLGFSPSAPSFHGHHYALLTPSPLPFTPLIFSGDLRQPAPAATPPRSISPPQTVSYNQILALRTSLMLDQMSLMSLEWMVNYEERELALLIGKINQCREKLTQLPQQKERLLATIEEKLLFFYRNNIPLIEPFIFNSPAGMGSLNAPLPTELPQLVVASLPLDELNARYSNEDLEVQEVIERPMQESHNEAEEATSVDISSGERYPKRQRLESGE